MITSIRLASASPRRRELLAQVGIPCIVVPADVDESPREGESPEAYVARLARAKADAVHADDGRTTLAADTAVVAEEGVLGKPVDDADARKMLALLRGRSHRVMTGFALRLGQREPRVRVVTTRVTFRAFDDRALDGYVATGEGRDKAGAYAIQGIGGGLVRGIEGSYTNVVGLPVTEVLEELLALGSLEHWP